MTPEEKSREVYPLVYCDDWDKEQELVAQQLDRRVAFVCGYEQAKKDTIVEVEKWLKANFHHRNCWNADEFCISLRTHFGIGE
jgi:hypothetical protein